MSPRTTILTTSLIALLMAGPLGPATAASDPTSELAQTMSSHAILDEPGVSLEAAEAWVYVVVSDSNLVVVNPLLIEDLGPHASTSTPSVPESDVARGRNPEAPDTSAQYVTFRMLLDLTGIAVTGNQIELFVAADNTAGATDVDPGDVLAGRSGSSPGSWSGGDLLAYFAETVPAGYGEGVLFPSVPAVSGAGYTVRVAGNDYVLYPFVEETEALPEDPLSPQPVSTHCGATTSEFKWENYGRGWESSPHDSWEDLAWGAWQYGWRYGECGISEDRGSAQVVFQDYFNDGVLDTSKWSYQGASETGDCGYTSSPRALYFSGTSGRSVTTKPLNVLDGGKIQFTYRHGTGTGGGPCDKPEPHHNDNFALEYSAQGGPWIRMETMYAGDHGSWSVYFEDIPDAAQTTETRFRWVVLNYAANTQRDHWALDDLTITANSGDHSKFGELKPGFGFGFRGQSEVSQGGLYNTVFGGNMDGDAYTVCRYYSGQHGQSCYGHVAWIQGAQFLYEEQAGTGIEQWHVSVDGRASSSCTRTLSDEAKVAMTIAAFKFPWLGFATLMPDRYCSVAWESTNYWGSPGIGADLVGVGSTEMEQPVSGFIATKYTQTGDFPVNMRGSVDYEVWMKACYTCTDERRSGTHYYDVYPVFKVVE